MTSVLIKPGQEPALEEVLPTDRIVEIDNNGGCYLADQYFVITDKMIKKVVFENPIEEV